MPEQQKRQRSQDDKEHSAILFEPEARSLTEPVGGFELELALVWPGG